MTWDDSADEPLATCHVHVYFPKGGLDRFDRLGSQSDIVIDASLVIPSTHLNG